MSICRFVWFSNWRFPAPSVCGALGNVQVVQRSVPATSDSFREAVGGLQRSGSVGEQAKEDNKQGGDAHPLWRMAPLKQGLAFGGCRGSVQDLLIMFLLQLDLPGQEDAHESINCSQKILIVELSPMVSLWPCRIATPESISYNHCIKPHKISW